MAQRDLKRVPIPLRNLDPKLRISLPLQQICEAYGLHAIPRAYTRVVSLVHEPQRQNALFLLQSPSFSASLT